MCICIISHLRKRYNGIILWQNTCKNKCLYRRQIPKDSGYRCFYILLVREIPIWGPYHNHQSLFFLWIINPKFHNGEMMVERNKDKRNWSFTYGRMSHGKMIDLKTITLVGKPQRKYNKDEKRLFVISQRTKILKNK